MLLKAEIFLVIHGLKESVNAYFRKYYLKVIFPN